MRRDVETTGSRWHAATPYRAREARRGARGARKGRWAAVALLTLTGFVAAPHTAHADGITDPNVLASVAGWSAAYDVDPLYVDRVILCESGGDVWAQNPSGASGILQFMPASFEAIRQAEMADTAIAPGLNAPDPEWRGVWNYDAQIHLFAWVVAHPAYGFLSWWVCS